MPPLLGKKDARKKAAVVSKGTSRKPASTKKDPFAHPLWRQVQVLDRANTVLLRSNEKLTLSNKELSLDNKELTRDNKELTHSKKDLTRSSDLISAESAQRRTRIAQLLDELATARRTHAADRARLVKRAGVIAGDLGKTLRDKRALRAQLTHDSLESKIHRAAAQVAYRMFEGRHDRDLLLRILKRCRRAYTGSDGPPPPRPPSPEPDTVAASAADLVGDFDEEDPFVVAEQQGVCTPTQPSRAMLITPVSIPPGPVSLTDSDDFVLHTPTRREGLRPRKPFVNPNGSPW